MSCRCRIGPWSTHRGQWTNRTNLCQSSLDERKACTSQDVQPLCVRTSTSIYTTPTTPYCAPKLIDWSLGFSWRNDMWMLCLSWHITCINWRQPWLKNAVDVPTRPSACIVIMKYPFPRFSLAGGDLQRKARVRKSVSASISCSQSTKEGNICQGVVPGINKVSYWFTDRHLPENMLAVFPPP